MIVGLKVWTASQGVGPVAEMAFVEISPERARGYLALIKTLEKMRETYHVWRITLWDTVPKFYAWPSPSLPDVFRHIAEGCSAPHVFEEMPDLKDTRRVHGDVVSLLVTVTGVKWEGYVSNTSHKMDTAEIRVDMLKSIAGVEDD